MFPNESLWGTMLRVGAVRYSPQPQYWLVDNMEPGQKEGKQGMGWDGMYDLV